MKCQLFLCGSLMLVLLFLAIIVILKLLAGGNSPAGCKISCQVGSCPLGTNGYSLVFTSKDSNWTSNQNVCGLTTIDNFMGYDRACVNDEASACDVPLGIELPSPDEFNYCFVTQQDQSLTYKCYKSVGCDEKCENGGPMFCYDPSFEDSGTGPCN